MTEIHLIGCMGTLIWRIAISYAGSPVCHNIFGIERLSQTHQSLTVKHLTDVIYRSLFTKVKFILYLGLILLVTQIANNGRSEYSSDNRRPSVRDHSTLSPGGRPKVVSE